MFIHRILYIPQKAVSRRSSVDPSFRVRSNPLRLSARNPYSTRSKTRRGSCDSSTNSSVVSSPDKDNKVRIDVGRDLSEVWHTFGLMLVSICGPFWCWLNVWDSLIGWILCCPINPDPQSNSPPGYPKWWLESNIFSVWFIKIKRYTH